MRDTCITHEDRRSSNEFLTFQENKQLLSHISLLKFVRSLILLLIFILAVSCTNFSRQQNFGAVLANKQPEEHYFNIFCLRREGFSGQGRTHLLKLDGQSMGQLTGSNYLQIKLWPGRYTFCIYLPPESFLGGIKPALSRTKYIDLESSDMGRNFVLQYIDGMENGSLSFLPLDDRESPLAGRILASVVDLCQTAQVRIWFKAHYTGPARQGRPHGWGILTWNDGCSYQGVFEYGYPTTRGFFFYPDGHYFRGNLRYGRPYLSGVLFTPDGQIAFSGDFKSEKPHGSGMRMGEQGPELCWFDNGKDTTKTVDQLALETLAAHQCETRKIQPARIVKKCLSLDREQQIWFHQNVKNHTEAVIPHGDCGTLPPMLDNIRPYQRDATLHRSADITLHPSLYSADRLGAIRSRIAEEQTAIINRKRAWCQRKFEQAQRCCQCALFAEDYLDWPACLTQ